MTMAIPREALGVASPQLNSVAPSTFVVKASGEAFGTDKTPLDYGAFVATAKEIESICRDGHRVAVVVGGGNIARGADIARDWQVSREIADEAGMIATGVNADLLGGVLQTLGLRVEIVPRGPLKGMPNGGWGPDAIRVALAEGAVVIIAGGLGVPGISSDVATLSLAADINAHAVLMAKHGVNGVYSADPDEDPTATLFDGLAASEALDKRLAFIDHQALELAIRNRITIRVVRADRENSLVRASRGEHLGTVVYPH